MLLSAENKSEINALATAVDKSGIDLLCNGISLNGRVDSLLNMFTQNLLFSILPS